jgi:hypothetical protein
MQSINMEQQQEQVQSLSGRWQNGASTDAPPSPCARQSRWSNSTGEDSSPRLSLRQVEDTKQKDQRWKNGAVKDMSLTSMLQPSRNISAQISVFSEEQSLKVFNRSTLLATLDECLGESPPQSPMQGAMAA